MLISQNQFTKELIAPSRIFSLTMLHNLFVLNSIKMYFASLPRTEKKIIKWLSEELKHLIIFPMASLLPWIRRGVGNMGLNNGWGVKGVGNQFFLSITSNIFNLLLEHLESILSLICFRFNLCIPFQANVPPPERSEKSTKRLVRKNSKASING